MFVINSYYSSARELPALFQQFREVIPMARTKQSTRPYLPQPQPSSDETRNLSNKRLKDSEP
jgi:hypothetical protein